MTIDISIITPSYNNSQWLKLCIASIADQEGVSVEHIVQDAGSNDGTLDWLLKDRRVKAFVEKDTGMYDAVNRGINRTAGDILAYLNCDEQYQPNALKTVKLFFEQNPDVEVALGGTIVVDGEGKYICHRPSSVPNSNLIWYRFPVLTSSVFYKRSVFEKKKLFFNTKWRDLGDKHFFIELLNNNIKMMVLNCYTSIFVDNGENMCLKPNARMERRLTLDMAPKWVKLFKPILILFYRGQKLISGHFNIKETTYSIYIPKSSNARCSFNVEKPTSIWHSRI